MISGTMAPSPLITMNLYLSDIEIIYIPARYEIRDTFTTVLEEIVHIMSTIPRLYEKFSLPSGGLKRFFEVIQDDADINKLQSLIDTGKTINYKQIFCIVMYIIVNYATFGNGMFLIRITKKVQLPIFFF